MQTRTRRLALTEGLVAGIFFGTAAVLIRFLQNLDAFSIAFWRLVIACLALGVIAWVLGKSFSLKRIKDNFKGLCILSFFLALHFIFFISAVKDTTILNATVLVNTTPIFSMFVSALVYKLKPSRIAMVGLAVSFVGVLVIGYAESMVTGSDYSGVSPSLKGDLEAVLAAVVEAFYLNYGRKIRAEMTILSTMTPIYAFTAIIVGVLGFPVTGKALQLPTEAALILPLVGLGLLPTAIAHTFYFSSLSNLKSFETATLALLEPIGATVLGIVVFTETPAPLFIFGAVLVLLGILFTVKEK